MCKNIGDYIQSVASRQYVDPVDEYIEQEEADKYQSKNGEKTRLIMNGWFQWRAENWPPSDDIIPLLISMHISPLRKELLLTEKGKAFLRKNSPVGCRDHYTENLLLSYGIPAYFSGCVTLTLGKKYKVPKQQREGFYFVDPYFEIPPLFEEIDGKKVLIEEAFNAFLDCYTQHSDIINKLARQVFFKVYSPTGFLDRDSSPYRSYYKAACFYKTYSTFFSDVFISGSEFITHWMDVEIARQSNQDLLDYAESLVRKYAKARMVVTSRIHAGLPCLGMETPVVFVTNEQVLSETGNFNTPGRLGGLVELFRTIRLDNGHICPSDSVLSSIPFISLDTSFDNKDDWRELADKLDRQLSLFMSDTFDESMLDRIRRIGEVKVE